MGKSKGGGDDEPPPLRLNYPLNYALHTWADYHRHGLMPTPGGYNEQDPAWVADMQAITRRYNWHVRQLLDQDEDGGGLRDADVDDFIVGVGQTEWRGLIGE
jgi:hypothetical protein